MPSRRTPEHTRSRVPQQPRALRQQSTSTAEQTNRRLDQSTSINAEDPSLNADPGCIKVVDTFRHVVAVDRGAHMVALAGERLRARCRVIQGNVSDLRDVVPDQTFDVILSSLVLYYLADPSQTFIEWERILRPSGTLVFSTHHPVQQGSLLDPGYLRVELIGEEWSRLGEKMRYHRRPLRDLTEPLAAACRRKTRRDLNS